VFVLPDSGEDPEGFIRGVIDAAAKIRFDALIGGTERDLLAIARNRLELGPLARGAPDIDTLLRITDKSQVNQLAADAGLSTPPTIEVDRSTLRSGAALHTPLLVKPMRSETETRTGDLVHVDALRVESSDELQQLAATLPGERWLTQRSIDGQLGAICGVAWGGEMICAVHQVAERIWPTRAGISAFAHTVAPDRALQDGVRLLLHALEWSGIYQVQFIHNTDASYMIDFNPRIYGSLALAVAAGTNLPAICVELIRGHRPQIAPYRVGVRYRAEEQDVRAMLHLLRTGHPLAASLALLPRRNTVHAVAKLGDPLPLLASLAKLRRRVARRAAAPIN
jgi:predicted ATP-grasp superfamily ATP-dependent carboligase